MGVTIQGLNAVLSRLDAVVANVHTQTNTAIGTAVQSTYDGSQTSVAVDTGDLKASGTQETHDLGGSVTYSTDHCWYVELGTVKMAAQPYLGPNFVLSCDQLKRDLAGMQP